MCGYTKSSLVCVLVGTGVTIEILCKELPTRDSLFDCIVYGTVTDEVLC